MMAGMFPKPPPPPSPPLPHPWPKSSPLPKSRLGSASVSGTGTAVGEGLVEAMTLAWEELGAEGLRWTWGFTSFWSMVSSSGAPAW